MKKIIILSALIGSTFLVTPASAQRATSFNQREQIRIANRHTDRLESIQQEIRDQSRLLVQSMRMQAGENSSHQQMQVEADKRIADAQEVNASIRDRQQVRIEAEKKFEPDPVLCLLLDLFGGGGEEGGEGGPTASPVRGAGSAAANDVKSRMSGSDPDVRQGGIRQAATAATTDTPFAGRADASTDPEILFEEAFIDYSAPGAVSAVSQMMFNLADTTPPPPVTQEEMKSEAGLVRAALYKEWETRRNAGFGPLTMVANAREGVAPAAPMIEMAKRAQGYNRMMPPEGGYMPEQQQIEIRGAMHYSPTPEEMQDRNNPSVALQKLLDLTSVMNRTLYLSYELQQRQAAVDSAILFSLIDPTSMN